MTREILGDFIEELEHKLDFELLDEPNFDEDDNHIGTLLVRNYQCERVYKAYDTFREEISDIDLTTERRLNCQLTVVGDRIVSGTIYLAEGVTN